MTDTGILEDIQRVYSLWAEGDSGAIELLFSRLSPNIRWKSLADGEHGLAFTRTRNGLEETAKYFDELLHQLELVHYRVTDILSKEELIIVVCDVAWRDRHSGRVFKGPKVDLFRLQGEQIVEFQEMYDTAGLATVCALSRVSG